jgi:hypothetical protein
MEYLNVLAAAAASWVFGALWYGLLSKPWMKAVNMPMTADGKPAGNGSPLPYILSAITMVIVAGFMRHVFATSGITTISAGALAGAGIGLFFISPWTMINNAYGMRPFTLTLIDGGYATIGCGLIGLVLTLF